MEYLFGTFQNNTLSERFRKITLSLPYYLPLHPKNGDCFGTFPKDTLSLPNSPPTAPAPQNDTHYLINRTSEHFGKISFRYLTLTPPHSKMTLTIS